MLTSLGANLAQEQAFTQRIADDNVKNYQLWNHRRKLAQVLGQDNAPAELQFAKEALDQVCCLGGCLGEGGGGGGGISLAESAAVAYCRHAVQPVWLGVSCALAAQRCRRRRTGKVASWHIWRCRRSHCSSVCYAASRCTLAHVRVVVYLLGV